KTPQQLARGTKFENWWIGTASADASGVAGRHRIEAAMKDPDVTVAMNMYPDDLSPVTAIHAIGESRPAFDQSVGIGEFSGLRIGSGLPLHRADNDEGCNGKSNSSQHSRPPVEGQDIMFCGRKTGVS